MSTLDTEGVEAFQSLGVSPEIAMRAAVTLYQREGDRLRDTNSSILDLKNAVGHVRQDVAA